MLKSQGFIMGIFWLVTIFIFGFKGVVGQSNEITENSLRLVGGSTSYEGRVEIYHEDEWGSICDHYWDDDEGYVVCRQLGYSGVDNVYSNAHFGEGTGIVWLGGSYCTGYESQFVDCYGIDWGYPYCDHSEDVGVRCLAMGWMEGDLRLTGGAGSYEGRVEIYHVVRWGASSDPHFGYNDAKVVCRQLGFPDGVAEYYEHSTPFEEHDEGAFMSWIGNVACDGSENRLRECDIEYNSGFYGYVYLEPDELNGVVCVVDESSTYNGKVRLMDGDGPSHGRVEIYLDDQWGTICDDGIHFSYEEAYVVCRSLGYEDVDQSYEEYDVPPGSDRIYLERLDCDGRESSLVYCDAHQLINYNCDHLNDAVIRCTTDNVRLVLGLLIGISVGAMLGTFLFLLCCVKMCKKSSVTPGSSANNPTIQPTPNQASGIPAPVPGQTPPSYSNHLSTYTDPHGSQQPSQPVFDPVGGHNILPHIGSYPAPPPTGLQPFTPQPPANMGGYSSGYSDKPGGPVVPAPPSYHSAAPSSGTPALGAPLSGYPSPGAPGNQGQGIIAVSQHPLMTTHHDDPSIQYHHVPVPHIVQQAAAQQVYTTQQGNYPTSRSRPMCVLI